MSDNRPTEWQWKTPEGGKIDGLSYNEWCDRGVKAWASRQGGVIAQIRESLKSGMFNSAAWDHAPATLDGLPAAWPPRMDWQWRRLERDMDARTWTAVAMWRYGGRAVETPAIDLFDQDGHLLSRERWESACARGAAKSGEWWAPADQDGNPCEWPEVEPQPVVVIPAAEMTALVLYGHQAMGGAWRYRYRDDDDAEWSPDALVWTMEDIREGEQWAPCDDRGEFCALRRVVAETGWVRAAEQRVTALEKDRDAARDALEQERNRADELADVCDTLDTDATEFRQQRDEWKILAARIVKLWDLGHGLGDVIEEMRMALAREGGEK